MYFITVPRWIRWMYPGLVWDMPVEAGEKILYLTFDDGPHPIATPFVLEQLKKYNAKGTFFCIGRNVADHQEIYRRILDEGHTVGNHTYNHLDGKKVDDQEYINDTLKAGELINSGLFRPPYGRITRFQSRILRGVLNARPPREEKQLKEVNSKTDADNAQRSPGAAHSFRIIMWSVLSADWDKKIDGKKCYENVILNARPGSIVVFHDSAKAMERLEYALPKVLEFYAGKGYRFHAIPTI